MVRVVQLEERLYVSKHFPCKAGASSWTGVDKPSCCSSYAQSKPTGSFSFTPIASGLWPLTTFLLPSFRTAGLHITSTKARGVSVDLKVFPDTIPMCSARVTDYV